MVSSSNPEGSSGTSAVAVRASREPASAPATRIDPMSNGRRPAAACNNVVFPRSVGPDETDDGAGPHVQVDADEGDNAAEALANGPGEKRSGRTCGRTAPAPPSRSSWS